MNSKSSTEYYNTAEILYKVSELYSSKHLSDICLVVGDVEYHCHRLILSLASNVFESMFSNQWAESATSRIYLLENEACNEYFGDFIQYFYTGYIKMTLHNVIPVLILSDKYNVRSLEKFCLKFMTDHLAQAAIAGCLGQWAEYYQLVGNDVMARDCKDFVSWNIALCQSTGLSGLTPQAVISILKRSNLVVYDEMTLFSAVAKWIEHYQEQLSDEADSGVLEEVMSHIRFPMMTLKELAQLLLCPLVRANKEFFMEKIALGIAFHSGKSSEVAKQIQDHGGAIQFTPRLYTANAFSTLLTVDNISKLPFYQTTTLFFTSRTSLAECEGDRSCEWVVDLYPKGVLVHPCYLITFDGSLQLPEYSFNTVRISITCKDPPPMTSRCPHLRVKIGILIYGILDGVECVRKVIQLIHQFNENERVMHIDDLLPSRELVPAKQLHMRDRAMFTDSGSGPPGYKRMPQLPLHSESSTFLVGPNKDMLKMHIIIQPADHYIASNN